MSRGASKERSVEVRGVAILDRLVAEGRIAPNLYDEVIIHAQRTQSTAEESILQLGLVPEAELLKYIAGLFRTRYVGSEKLAKAAVDPWLLGKVPKKLAKRLTAFPILYDSRSRAVSVVAADMSDDDVRQQMQFATGAREVKVYVAREAAIRAAIAKHYDQNNGPFEMLLSGASSRQVHSVQEPEVPPGWGQMFDEESGELIQKAGAIRVDSERVANDQQPLEPESEEPPPQTHARAVAGPTETEEPSAPAHGGELSVDPDTYLGTLNVLVTLIEQLNQERGGHSMRVARLCKQLGERIRLTEAQIQGIQIAAYLHDLGVAASSHVTAFDVLQDATRRDLARRVYTAPSRLLESVALPAAAVEVLRHRFERFDGKGFPERLDGKTIPLGARVLAVAESYIDLTQNKGNILGRRVAPEDACDALEQHKGTGFDPALVDWLRQIVGGDDMRSGLLSVRHRALIVDPDPEETSVLEVQFTSQGYEVVIERTMAGGLAALDAESFDVVVSEVRLGDGSGFDFLDRLRRAGSTVPLMFVTHERNQASVNRGLELGASDYVVKPASAPVVVAKAGRILGDVPAKKPATRGVSGSIEEMGLPDVIQILANGRKSGKLLVTSGSLYGEMLFQEGSIHDASFGDLAGAEAVYGILRLTEGDFALEPDDTPVDDAIGIPTHHLLLEAMRRLDEEQR